MFDRVVLIVMDSVGIGELPDAGLYGDRGSNTLGNIYRKTKGFSLPNLECMGLGNIQGISGIPACPSPCASFGKCAEMSPGKDTITGHWEMMGAILERPFPTYPEGFPQDIIDRFERSIDRKVLGNKVASGTNIIDELGDIHMETGYPIVYTSADSVFQIAAHEEVIPVEQLYQMCGKARAILTGKNRVARVIARPFVGKTGSFTRTANRRDFSVEPPDRTLLDVAKEQGFDVIAVGKITDIFNGRGITRHEHTSGNNDGMLKTLDFINEDNRGIIFTNLVDFDMIFGHRNNIEGYATALKEFDDGLVQIMSSLTERDVLILTADHGCDPTTLSTDHSREYVPLFIYGERIKKGIDIGIRKSFADIGATIAHLLKIEGFDNGESFADLIT